MITNVDQEKLSSVRQNDIDTLAKLRVFLFCMKYPKLKFTAECLAVNQAVDKVVLEKEIQYLIREGILLKQINDSGVTYYHLNKTQEEMTELTERFLRDLRLHASD